MMSPPRPTELLHILLSKTIRPGDTVIDATCGNGHDTVFLARLVGPSGHVVAIDIQSAAIEATCRKLVEHDLMDRVTTHLKSHEQISELASPASASAIIFNLGYLPGSDHSLITSTPTTLMAIGASFALLKPGGTLAAVCYPGHNGGDEEAIAVETLLCQNPGMRVAKYSILATRTPAPFLLLATKQ